MKPESKFERVMLFLTLVLLIVLIIHFIGKTVDESPSDITLPETEEEVDWIEK